MSRRGRSHSEAHKPWTTQKPIVFALLLAEPHQDVLEDVAPCYADVIDRPQPNQPEHEMESFVSISGQFDFPSASAVLKGRAFFIQKGPFYEKGPTSEKKRRKKTYQEHSRDEHRIWSKQKKTQKGSDPSFK